MRCRKSVNETERRDFSDARCGYRGEELAVRNSVVEFECVSREIGQKKGIKWPLTEEMLKWLGNTAFLIRWVINEQSVAPGDRKDSPQTVRHS